MARVRRSSSVVHEGVGVWVRVLAVLVGRQRSKSGHGIAKGPRPGPPCSPGAEAPRTPGTSTDSGTRRGGGELPDPVGAHDVVTDPPRGAQSHGVAREEHGVIDCHRHLTDRAHDGAAVEHHTGVGRAITVDDPGRLSSIVWASLVPAPIRL